MVSQKEIFKYLDSMERQGAGYMINAKPYLIEVFELPPYRANEMVDLWIKDKLKRKNVES